DGDDLERFLFWQALVSLVVLATFVGFYRKAPPPQVLQGHASRLALSASFLDLQEAAVGDRSSSSVAQVLTGAVPSASSASRPPSLSRQPSFDTEMRGGAHGGHRGGVTDLFRTIRSYPSFSFQVLAFGTLGGVGFA
ncbi:unnamed protein product, partial [Polarella glacialis]